MTPHPRTVWRRPETILPALAHAVAYSVALGSGAFVAAHPETLASLDHNTVPAHVSSAILGWVGAAFVALCVIHGIAVAHARRLADGRGVAEVVAEVHRRLRWVLALPIVEALALPGIERAEPRETLLLAGSTSGSSEARSPSSAGPTASVTDLPPCRSPPPPSRSRRSASCARPPRSRSRSASGRAPRA